MALAFGELARAAFAPPRYLAPPLAGIDLSTSGVKAVRLTESPHGLLFTDYAQELLPAGAFTDGEIVDRATVVRALVTAAEKVGIKSADVALPESKSYLFETTAPGAGKGQWYTTVEQHIDEMVPLPPQETAFDVVKVGEAANGDAALAGIGFARRVVQETLSAYDAAGIQIRALESETFAIARALLPPDDDSTVLIIDVGKTTTKLSILSKHIPRFTTTIGIGGHALTLAVQKHFGVTENEARRVKAERGIVPAPGNEDYLASMLSTVSAIRDELARRLDYWQGHATSSSAHEPVSRALLVGGNASVRGFPEYLEGALHVPVATGDVFMNLASRDVWLPSLDYNESLAYATAIGLALRDRYQSYA